ncbi:hypothetical protein E0Z10_g6868 [Xylaria hypoxylon]|uniref:Major facilitator superfamily (MFS) profile domain-containing protein n=1 Tax=Xylaria hypoxylon TaxID=37992 RepID=A0A4Z0YD26_9PEZI|nr:hypothetical protein E0Z10_g6868 [Xylaria hypoxylon]
MSEQIDSPGPERPTSARKRFIANRLLSEVGLISLWESPRDVKLLCGQRFVRMLGYGISTLILVAYLDALGNQKTKIGLFMTLTLVGDICISFFLTLFADKLGRKATLAFGALLMTGSGVVFALSRTYWVLLIAAIVGVISPNGNEIGPFRAIEESIVAQLIVPENRSDIYAWYSLFGLAGAAFGFMICGWVLQLFTENLRWDLLNSYRVIYLVYAAIGLLKLCLTLVLSYSVESEKKQQQKRQIPGRGDETTPLLNDEGPDNEQEVSAEAKYKTGLRAILPNVSKDSVSVVTILCFLFAINAFGSGTMVITHLPSQVFRALIGVPNNMHIALLFCIINASTTSMDTGPRSAFLATIILPEERTAVIGTLNVVKTIASSLGPIITGTLVDHNLYWVSFVLSGSLKALYDVGLLIFFRHKEREREKSERDRMQRQE